ncbi:MAG: carboxymuconolactone decarboxylase family protein [Acidimicrobiales bacterium]
MTEASLTPRIEPVPPDERVGDVRELLDQARIGTGPDANIFATLVRAPGLFRRWMPFGGKLLNGKIPARDRELLILRTAWNCRAAYEWGQHARIALSCGVTPEEIDRTILGPEADGWAPADATLLRAADELHSIFRISDGTWADLAAGYSTEQLIELPMLVGHYHLVAMTLNSLDVQLDEGLSGFPA